MGIQDISINERLQKFAEITGVFSDYEKYHNFVENHNTYAGFDSNDFFAFRLQYCKHYKNNESDIKLIGVDFQDISDIITTQFIAEMQADQEFMNLFQTYQKNNVLSDNSNNTIGVKEAGHSSKMKKNWQPLADFLQNRFTRFCKNYQEAYKPEITDSQGGQVSAPLTSVMGVNSSVGSQIDPNALQGLLASGSSKEDVAAMTGLSVGDIESMLNPQSK